MSAQEYLGQITLTVNGTEVEVVGFGVKANTGRKAVKVMNRKLRSKGFVRGMADYELSLTCNAAISGPPIDFAAVENAKVTMTPLGGGGPVTYTDCYTTEVGEQYKMDEAAVFDLKMIALNKVTE